jgi:hypothetical protein
MVGKGAFSLIIVGVDRWSGNIVACKIIYCRDYNKKIVTNEVLIVLQIPLGIVGLVSLLLS